MFGKTKKRLDYLERKVLELEHEVRRFKEPTQGAVGETEKQKGEEQPSLKQIVNEWLNGKENR